jgi:V8-like Glu-specific endopeptidase
MGILAPFARRRTAATFTLTAFTLTATLAGATAAAASAHPAGAAGPPAVKAVTVTMSPAAQRATHAFWTPAEMARATPLARPSATTPPPAPGPPAIPKPTRFDGVPTVGALFFTMGLQGHFCTASVVNSLTANLVITAAHCVYGSAPATNIEYVPGYHNRLRPYGAWPVKTVTVAAGWQSSHDPNLDFAFLTVTPPSSGEPPIQFVTGGLWLGIDQGYDHPVYVIGYNDTRQMPIGCATTSFEFEPSQMKLRCWGYWNGTSGGPWITGYNPSNGTGTVIGVIGGYEQGGNVRWASYSAYFGLPTLQLFVQAQAQQA